MAVDGTFYRIKPETLFEVHRGKTFAGAGEGEPKRQSEIKFIVGTVDINTGEGSRSIVRTDAATADIFGMPVADIESADLVVIVGSNLRHELPLVHQRPAADRKDTLMEKAS